MNLSNKDKILDISVNLTRVSHWILDDSPIKQQRVNQFLVEIQEYLQTMHKDNLSSRFQSTFTLFTKEFNELLKEKGKIDKEEWAEKAQTWANILQHRASLA